MQRVVCVPSFVLTRRLILVYNKLEAYILNGSYAVKGSLSVYEKDSLWDQIRIMYACVDIDTHLNDFFMNSNGDICLIISGLDHGAGDYSIIQMQRDAAGKVTSFCPDA